MSELIKLGADDPLAITDERVRAYEAATGKTLYPGQIERLLIDLIAYRETLVRTAINDTGRQNLVAFSRAPMLDYLGELVGVTRLPEALTMRWTCATSKDGFLRKLTYSTSSPGKAPSTKMVLPSSRVIPRAS